MHALYMQRIKRIIFTIHTLQYMRHSNNTHNTHLAYMYRYTLTVSYRTKPDTSSSSPAAGRRRRTRVCTGTWAGRSLGRLGMCIV